MWPLNCWYVAGFAKDIGGSLVARTFLNHHIVMWRTSTGKLVAMEDRCPHRLVPLSTGRVVNDTVECGYHGLRFNAEGRCAFVPGQDTLPKGAPVKTFPIAERHALVWLWFGAADLADEALIPDLHWMDAPRWTPVTGYHHFNCDYRLINDNLLDLSHETYIHKHTIGHGSVADSPVVSNVIGGRLVRAHREMPDIDPPPFFAAMQGHGGKINRWQVAIYMAPGINMTEAAFHAVGTDRATQSFITRPLHLITPETEHTAHYFWGLPRNFRLDDESLSQKIHEGVVHTFNEDRVLLELQDKRLQAENMPQIPQLAVKTDIAPVQGRRLLADLIQREKDDPRFVLPPVSLADDAVITMPYAQAAE